jgi:hypothetical protein
LILIFHYHLFLNNFIYTRISLSIWINTLFAFYFLF